MAALPSRAALPRFHSGESPVPLPRPAVLHPQPGASVGGKRAGPRIHWSRDHATNEFWGLPVFHPRLHLAADAGLLAVGAEQEIHRYETSGERLWTGGLPSPETSDRRIISTDLP